MVFITTFNKPIYQICGKQLLESFIATNNHIYHKLVIFFENDDDIHTEHYPDWLVEWAHKDYFIFINLMNYEYDGKRVVDYIDATLTSKITHDHLYNSSRSVKWFRPVAAMQYANELFDENFCSIDSDCLFIKQVDEQFFNDLLDNTNIAFFGRENFKIMRHGGYAQNGEYTHTNTVEATNADKHTETGFIAYNVRLQGTKDFIHRNFDYWVSEDILNLDYKTDCHTFDATRREYNLNYKNLCDPMGEVSPIGSRVIEDSIIGSFLIHHKGTIGPILQANNLV